MRTKEIERYSREKQHPSNLEHIALMVMRRDQPMSLLIEHIEQVKKILGT